MSDMEARLLNENMLNFMTYNFRSKPMLLSKEELHTFESFLQ